MSEKLKTRIVSSLEKCFLDEKETDKKAITSISMLENDRCSFQLIGRVTDEECNIRRRTKIKVISPIADKVTLRTVKQVPVRCTTYRFVYEKEGDGDYLRTEPGLFPDLLAPVDDCGRISFYREQLSSVWVDVENVEQAGVYPIKFEIYNDDDEDVNNKSLGELIGVEEISVEVINARLPEQTLLYTQWFYCDCLASYYKVEIFSEEHWKIIENYLRNAAKNGINQILTPIVTPPLDTRIGSERPTVQLVKISKNGSEYSFDFTLLDRWIAVCQKCGINHFEMAHLYTQWGVSHAPKIMATVDGEYTRIFGWETDAQGEEYKEFLGVFLTALDKYFTGKGLRDFVAFHISDEPGPDDAERYRDAYNLYEKYIPDYPVMDALSDIVYYEKGICKCPVPSTNHIHKFLEKGFSDIRTYYCCAEAVRLSNRFIALPSSRNRVLSAQLYKFKVRGFLHWGYNFYYSQYSNDLIDPYFTTDADYFSPAGDAFGVYPGADGNPVESIHMSVFTDCLHDLRAMQLCEKLYSREFVMAIIDEELGENMDFKEYKRGNEPVENIRARVNEAIKNAVK